MEGESKQKHEWAKRRVLHRNVLEAEKCFCHKEKYNHVWTNVFGKIDCENYWKPLTLGTIDCKNILFSCLVMLHVTKTHWHPITWKASWGWWLWPWCPFWWIWFAMFSKFWIQQILLRTDKYNTESSFPFYRRTNVVHMTQKSLGAVRLTDRTSFKIDFLELKYWLQKYTFLLVFSCDNKT